MVVGPLRRLAGNFPRLVTEPHKVTSPGTLDYNCIAWAAGDTERCWWPVHQYYWPQGVPKTVELDSFEKAFRLKGYQLCKSAELEPGFEKIAIYTDHKGEPTHAARQLPSGLWTSKLGADVDIEHETPDSLNGPQYGATARIMKRATDAPGRRYLWLWLLILGLLAVLLFLLVVVKTGSCSSPLAASCR